MRHYWVIQLSLISKKLTALLLSLIFMYTVPVKMVLYERTNVTYSCIIPMTMIDCKNNYTKLYSKTGIFVP